MNDRLPDSKDEDDEAADDFLLFFDRVFEGKCVGVGH